MRATLALLLLTAFLDGRPAAAQPFTPAQRAEVAAVLRDALRSDPSLLRDAIRAMQADDARQQAQATRDMLALLEPQLATDADPVAGNPQGDVTVVEFYDTRCPYCRQMMGTTSELLRRDAGVRVVWKDLPILGANSLLEARALLAAQRQGGYAPMQASVMRGGPPPTRDSLRAEADRLGLDGARLLRDMDDPAVKARLDANIALAQQLGIQGTPALVVGRRLLAGAVDIGDLQAAVTEARAGR